MTSVNDTTSVSPMAAEAPGSKPAVGLHTVLFIGLAVLLAVLPLTGLGPFVLVVTGEILCFALFACAFNLTLGFAGLLSFGHAMFFGLSAYVTAFSVKHGLPALGIPPLTPELGVLAGTAVAAVLGLVTGSLAIRRQGIYFAMITLALARIVQFFCEQAPFTGGENGIQFERGAAFGLIDLKADSAAYYAAAIVFMAGFLLVYRIVHSPFGQVLKAIRDNEPRAVSLGYRAARYKLAAFVLSAALSGAAGGTKAIVAGVAALTDVHWSMSGEVILMTLIGGIGTMFGPVIGAALIAAIPYINDFGVGVPVVQGTIFVICVLLFKEGIVGVVARALRKPL
jgi:branched-chain amino acid transport system permease protein